MAKRDRHGNRYQRRWDDREVNRPAATPAAPEALLRQIDAMYVGGHPMRGYSQERRLGWDEAMATVRALAAATPSTTEPAPNAGMGQRLRFYPDPVASPEGLDVEHASNAHYAQAVNCGDETCPLNWKRLTQEAKEEARG